MYAERGFYRLQSSKQNTVIKLTPLRYQRDIEILKKFIKINGLKKDLKQFTRIMTASQIENRKKTTTK